jgi:hypothetical protein
MKNVESLSLGSDYIAHAFCKGDTLVLFTADNGLTTVRLFGDSFFQVVFTTRKDAVQFVKDTANGMPMQYNKRTNASNKELTMVRLCFVHGWATMNTDGECF